MVLPAVPVLSDNLKWLINPEDVTSYLDVVVEPGQSVTFRVGQDWAY